MDLLIAGLRVEGDAGMAKFASVIAVYGLNQQVGLVLRT
jgi:hypothetical protein